MPELVGQHNKVAIVLNFVPNTTFDTDKFSHDHTNEIQVFGWNVWEMFNEAERLYPYADNVTIGGKRDMITRRMKHVITKTLLGIATAMVLTDGSLKAVTLKAPDEDDHTITHT